MKISTKDSAGTARTFIPKGITPGTHKCVLREIKFEKQAFIKDRNEWILHLTLETEPVGNGFTGFDKVFGQPQHGQYSGQVARVRSSQWGYYDGKTPNGYEVSIQQSVVGFLTDLCKELGIIDWWYAQDGEHETVQALVEAFNKAKPFNNIFMYYCLGGREYINRNGYTQNDLFIVRAEKGKKSFCGDLTQVTKFDPSKHVIRSKPKELKEGFTAEESKPMKSQGISTNSNDAGSYTNALNEDFKAQQERLKQQNVVKENPFPENDVEEVQSDIISDDGSDSLPFSLD